MRGHRMPYTRRVRAALDKYITEHGLDGKLGEIERRELMVALARLRHVELVRQRRPPTEVVTQERYARELAAADRVFHERLGIGVAEFIASQREPGTLEDLGGARQQ